VGGTPGESLLDSIRRLHRLSEKVAQDLQRAVSQARQAGHTWTEIGEAMHMSKQSAWERFGRERRQAQPKATHRTKGRQS